MAGFSAPKLLWISRNEPETHALVAHALLPKDYTGYCMHGQFVTDPSDAAGTPWLDRRTRTWSARMYEISATDPNWLPDIRYGTEIAGELRANASRALGLAVSLLIAIGAGASAAGAVGIGAVEAGDGFISIGTSGQLFVTTGKYRPNPESRTHANAHTVPDHWFQMAAMRNSARPIAWLADLLGAPIEHLLAEAETAQAGPVFLPYLTGERTPHDDAKIRGGLRALQKLQQEAA